ncbi:glycosyl transferase family protein [Spongiibacter sp. KMU-158]|uniref:Glycosyl transferase family protein n=1 Tax=Spongiibacter pelagi TaxID=2760804 RepID=A0A927GWE2_9GAMM|nr:glycosyl transferase family protein [Spongiibacter pelagi]MBD2859651.1 glycosyl transferase family protein [Spongiibacter pelagi]
MNSAQEHPFAQYVRILGKGKTGSRSLEQNEARDAMGMILRGEVEDVQLGAFLMLLRVKEESSAELAGFVQAVRDELKLPSIAIDLDWASYAGKRRQQAWYLLAALALADSGIKTLMHGACGHTAGRVYSETLLAQLGEAPVSDIDQLETTLNARNFAFLPLQQFSPVLQRIMDLRNQFGLRSPVHTLSRLINPLAAEYSVQSIFHPAYADSHQHAAHLLGQKHAAVFKGEAGEAERKPEANCKVKYLHNGQLSEVEWPRMLEGRQAWQEDLNPQVLLDAWQHDRMDEYGRLAILGSMAIALQLRNADLSCEQALAEAEQHWQQRDRQRLQAQF